MKQEVTKETPKKANESVVAPTTAPATVAEVKIKNTPVGDRIYQLVAMPSVPPKGKQRQIVLAALNQDPTRGYTAAEVAAYATKAGLQATAGVEPSCRWHLHHLGLLGIAKVLNPKVEIRVIPNEKKEEVTA